MRVNSSNSFNSYSGYMEKCRNPLSLSLFYHLFTKTIREYEKRVQI